MDNALYTYLQPATILILRGEIENLKAWQQLLFNHYLPDVYCFALAMDTSPPVELVTKKPPQADVSAYICEGLRCQEPLTDFDDSMQYLSENKAARPADKGRPQELHSCSTNVPHGHFLVETSLQPPARLSAFHEYHYRAQTHRYQQR
jgi:hypothetical protein